MYSVSPQQLPKTHGLIPEQSSRVARSIVLLGELINRLRIRQNEVKFANMFSGSISDGPHSITHGDACFAYFIKICGIPFRLIISLNLACSNLPRHW